MSLLLPSLKIGVTDAVFHSSGTIIIIYRLNINPLFLNNVRYSLFNLKYLRRAHNLSSRVRLLFPLFLTTLYKEVGATRLSFPHLSSTICAPSVNFSLFVVFRLLSRLLNCCCPTHFSEMEGGLELTLERVIILAMIIGYFAFNQRGNIYSTFYIKCYYFQPSFGFMQFVVFKFSRLSKSCLANLYPFASL